VTRSDAADAARAYLMDVIERWVKGPIERDAARRRVDELYNLWSDSERSCELLTDLILDPEYNYDNARGDHQAQ
jgi:hypothetical protein